MRKPKLPPLDPQVPSRLHRFLTLPRVIDITGLARALVYKKMAEGSFPRQVRITSKPDAKRFISVWVEDEVVAWQEARLAERDAERPALPINRPEIQARAKWRQHGDRGEDRLPSGMPLPPLPRKPRKGIGSGSAKSRKTLATASA